MHSAAICGSRLVQHFIPMPSTLWFHSAGLVSSAVAFPRGGCTWHPCVLRVFLAFPQKLTCVLSGKGASAVLSTYLCYLVVKQCNGYDSLHGAAIRAICFCVNILQHLFSRVQFVLPKLSTFFIVYFKFLFLVFKYINLVQ